MQQTEFESSHMARALELAARGEGFVEPNPMVGCVVVQNGEIVGEGFHQRFGGPHAEVDALQRAGARASGADVYVTLEPCCHHGKTPPCTQALIKAGVQRVVVAGLDPFPQVAGRGVQELTRAGIEVEVGLLQREAKELSAPYRKLVEKGRPWIIAKWAMTLDGKLATRTGDSRWISCEESRAIVHRLRGRVNAIMVGRNTATTDDPLLTARPPGPRTAVRIVVDSNGSLSSESQLARTAGEVPVVVATSRASLEADRQRLVAAGCDVLVCEGDSHGERLAWLLDELGRSRMTNVLVEGGGALLGSLLDLGEIDEVHAFIAPKIVGGHAATTPLAGEGMDLMANALALCEPVVERSGVDVYVHGRVKRV
jgi:diaminohydroxyphosphoribosylaminopyrimidine deaminase/5-amino-6-(5-phosphoribosylamino)uracil reductase